MNYSVLLVCALLVTISQPYLCFGAQGQKENGPIGNEHGSRKVNDTPIQRNDVDIGVLDIRVYPQECNVSLNRKHLGSGNQWIDSLPGGYYEISVEYNGKSKSDSVFVQSRKVTTIQFSLKRTFKFESTLKS